MVRAPSAARPQPRPFTRRGLITIAILIPIVAIAYIFVVENYSIEGGSTVTGGLRGEDPGIVVDIEPVNVETSSSSTTLRLTFSARGEGFVNADDRLVENTRVTITTSDGTEEVKYVAGDSLGRYEIEMGTSGDVASYPFDVHQGFFAISADTFTRGAAGVIESTGSIPVGLVGTGGVNGWNTTMELPPSMGTQVFGVLTFSRVFSTKIFALLLILMAAALAILAFFAAALVITNRRNIEVALLAWTASLLFALPLLRTYLPNAPPIGAAIDIYVYLWVMVLAVIAAVLVVLAWIFQSAAKLRVQDGS